MKLTPDGAWPRFGSNLTGSVARWLTLPAGRPSSAALTNVLGAAAITIARRTKNPVFIAPPYPIHVLNRRGASKRHDEDCCARSSSFTMKCVSHSGHAHRNGSGTVSFRDVTAFLHLVSNRRLRCVAVIRSARIPEPVHRCFVGATCTRRGVGQRGEESRGGFEGCGIVRHI